MEMGQRLKVTHVLNDSRINVLKLLVSQSKVEFEIPELLKTFTFSKDLRTDQQVNYLNYYSVVNQTTGVD